MLALTKQTGELLERSIKDARKLASVARRRARGRGAQAKLAVARQLVGAGGSLRDGRPADSPASGGREDHQSDRVAVRSGRPAIRKGKIGKPTEFGYVSELAEVPEDTKPGARGLILPASHQIGNPSENTLLPGTVAELTRLGITPRGVAVDGGFQPTPTNVALAELDAKTVLCS